MIGRSMRFGQAKGGAAAEHTQCLWYVAALENAVQNHLDHFTKNFPCYFEWRIPAWVLGAVGQMERQWVKVSHPCSPLLTPAQVTVARAQGGITPGPEEGELGADFTNLGTQRPGLRAILQFSRVQS